MNLPKLKIDDLLIRNAKSLAFLLSGMMNLGMLNGELLSEEKLIKAFDDIAELITKSPSFDEPLRIATNALFEVVFFCRQTLNPRILSEEAERKLAIFFKERGITSIGEESTISESQKRVQRSIIDKLKVGGGWTHIPALGEGGRKTIVGDFEVITECPMAKIAGIPFKPSDIAVVVAGNKRIVKIYEVDGDKHYNLYDEGSFPTEKTLRRNGALSAASGGKLVVLGLGAIEEFIENKGPIGDLEIGDKTIPQEHSETTDLHHTFMAAGEATATAATVSLPKTNAGAGEGVARASHPSSGKKGKGVAKGKSKGASLTKPAIQIETEGEKNHKLLHQMVKDHDIESARYFLRTMNDEMSASLINSPIYESRDSDGLGEGEPTSLLKIATESNDLGMVLLFIENGANTREALTATIPSPEMFKLLKFALDCAISDTVPDSSPEEISPGNLPFAEAINRFHKVLPKLLESRAKISSDVTRDAALIGDNIDLLRIFLISNCMKKDKDFDNLKLQILTNACQVGRVSWIDFLIHDHKLSVNSVYDGHTLIYHATFFNQIEAVRYLIENEALVKEDVGCAAGKQWRYRTCKIFGFRKKIDPNFLDEGTSILYFAVRCGNEKSGRGKETMIMPLEIQEKYKLIAEILLKAGANIEIGATDPSTGISYSPLTKTCTEGSIEIAKFLLERGANPNTKSDKRSLLFYLAAQPPINLKMIRMLCEHGIVSTNFVSLKFFKSIFLINPTPQTSQKTCGLSALN